MAEQLTTKQAYEFLGVSKTTIKEWRRTGKGPKFTRNASGDFLYDVEELRYWQQHGGIAVQASSDDVGKRQRTASELPARRREETKAAIWEIALKARFVEGVGMVSSTPCPKRGWVDVPPWGALHWAFDIRRNAKGEDCVPDFVKENVRRVREAQAGKIDITPLPELPILNMEGVDTSAWHRQDGSPIDPAPADEIVHNTAGGRLPAAIARELLSSHAAGRAPNYAQAQKDIEAAQAARTQPAPIPYDDWKKASGVLNLPSRR